jgi:threonylcarbamoyladenosine tRNA methylthiotransferase MtaB
VGYTPNYLKVIFEGHEDMIGKLVKVKITEAGYPYNNGIFVKVENEAAIKEAVSS